MRRLNFLLALIAILIAGVFQNCQKIIDRLANPQYGPQTNCVIKNIILSENREDKVGIVTSDELGQPLSVTYNLPRTYSNEWRFFTYDDTHRLVSYIVELEEDLEIEHHTYGYDDNNRIITDTGTFTLTGYIKIVSTLEYDLRGRIIKESEKIIDIEEGSEPWEIEPTIYEYNEQGNLVDNNHNFQYDNKINFKRTSKIWMFVTRDYSLNNKVVATEYNEFDLPVSFGDERIAWFDSGSIYAIEYDCKDPSL